MTLLSRRSPAAYFWAIYFPIAVATSPASFRQSLHAQTKQEEKAKDNKPKGDKTDKSDKSKEQPLELPEFVITGVEAIDVPGGSKLSPQKSAKLSAADLERFNASEKTFGNVAAPFRLPEIREMRQQTDGFLRGEYGLFVSPSVLGGYHAVAGNFDLYARAGGERSAGHLANAGYTRAAGALEASYVAPEKFFFFGGSKTDSRLEAGWRSYNLYANTNAPERSVLDVRGGLSTVGAFEGAEYAMGAEARFAALDRTIPAAEETSFGGNLALKFGSEALKLGARANLRLQTWRGTAGHFFQSVGLLEYNSGTMLASIEMGAQIARASNAVERTVPAGVLRAEYHAAASWTLRLSAATGLVPNSFTELLERNPYISDTALVEYSRAVYDAGIGLLAHPSPSMRFALGVRARSVERFSFFTQEYLGKSLLPAGTFSALYADVSIVEAEGEISWQPRADDIVSGYVRWTSSSLRADVAASASGEVPYLPALRAAVSYRRLWGDSFTTIIGFAYSGERLTSVAGATLPAYSDVSFSAEYAFTKRLSVFARLQNAIDSRIVIWQGYLERGRFGAVGATITF